MTNNADSIARLRQRREATVRLHAEAENQHDVEATIATFHQPRYEFNGKPSDGAQAVRELLQGFMRGFSDFRIEPGRLRHLDDGVLVEGVITGTHDGEWAGIPPTGREVNIPVAGIFEFDDDRLVCEKVHLDTAALLSQVGAAIVPPLGLEPRLGGF